MPQLLASYWVIENTTAPHATPVFINLIDSAILNWTLGGGNYSITVNSQVFPITALLRGTVLLVSAPCLLNHLHTSSRRLHQQRLGIHCCVVRHHRLFLHPCLIRGVCRERARNQREAPAAYLWRQHPCLLALHIRVGHHELHASLYPINHPHHRVRHQAAYNGGCARRHHPAVS